MRGNGYDPEKTASFVERVENLNARKESLHMDYMRECATIAEDIGEVLDEAKAAGLKKKSIKAVVKRHALERKIENIRDDMEPEDADDYDQVLQALGEFGDSPLGAAALAKAPKNGTEAHA